MTDDPGRPLFSDYVVYVDESGDHSLVSIDPLYPVFVLAFCILAKSEYARQIGPAVQEFKFEFFGHDMVILHETDIRKARDDFRILQREEVRGRFLSRLNAIIDSAPFTLIATVIRKDRLTRQYAAPENPYHLALTFCLERTYRFLAAMGQGDRLTHVVFERRGKKEDAELELEFRRVCDGNNYQRERFPFRIIMADKKTNSSGLQLADMVARPIGLRTLRPDQQNRAYDILERKFYQSGKGVIDGWGLKNFP